MKVLQRAFGALGLYFHLSDKTMRPLLQFDLLQNSCASKSTLSSHRGTGISTHTHMHTHVHVCTCTRVCVDMHCAGAHVCTGVCMYVYRCIRVFVHVCMQMHTHMHAHTHTHTYASSSPTVNLPPQREAMTTTARCCCKANGLVISCSSDMEGLMEERRGPGGDGKLSPRKRRHRHSPPSRPHSLRQGLWEGGA